MSSIQLYKDPIQSAKVAGLRYVTDEQPGIRRQRWGRGFSYIDIDGSRIKDKKRRAQFKALVIPPSWQDVWICCQPNGHLRATGRDLKKRKQYRYHPEWIALRKQLKFDRLIPFAKALPTLRQQTAAIIKSASASSNEDVHRETVIAAIIQLLDNTFIRIGNQQYSQRNDSYGATTLQDNHAKICAGKIELTFVGKSGVSRQLNLQDKKLAKIIKRCQEIPGQTLFQYFDKAGNRQEIESGDINEYLRSVMGSPFTAKDFRTWGGTVTAANVLHRMAAKARENTTPSEAEMTSNIVEAIKIAAQRLGNRPATCRKYYIHPCIFKAYKNESLEHAIKQCYPTESALLNFLDSDEQKTLAILMANKI